MRRQERAGLPLELTHTKESVPIYYPVCKTRLEHVKVGILSLALLCTTISSARSQVQQLRVWNFGNWRGALVVSPSGQFERCNAVVEYADGTAFGFGLLQTGAFRLILTNTRFNLSSSAGADRQVSISIDNGSSQAFRARTISADQLSIDLGSDVSLIERLRRGRQARIDGGVTATSYSLDGSSGALIKMLDCGSTVYNAARAVPSGTTQQVAFNVDGRPVTMLGESVGGFGSAISTLGNMGLKYDDN